MKSDEVRRKKKPERKEKVSLFYRGATEVSVLFNLTMKHLTLKLRVGYLYSRLAISFSLCFVHRTAHKNASTEKNERRKTVANYEQRQHKFRDWENALMCTFPSNRIIMMRAHHVSQNIFAAILLARWSFSHPTGAECETENNFTKRKNMKMHKT